MPRLSGAGGLLLSAVLMTCSLMALQQKKSLTLDDLYHPDLKKEFDGSLPNILRWSKDGEHYIQLKKTRKSPFALYKVNARSGESTRLYDLAEVRASFASLRDLDEGEAGRLLRQGSSSASQDESGIVWLFKGDLYYFDLATRKARRLTQTPEEEREPSFSPDGRTIAFVRHHDLYVIDVESGKERRLTRDGQENVLNGLLDWLYQEEVYGRGKFRGYWWSPDSKRIAYLQLDESAVPLFTLVDQIPPSQRREETRYPKAGDPNPIARLGVISSRGGRTRWISPEGADGEQDLLFVRVGWNNDGSRVVFQLQNREQTWLDLNLGDPENGRVSRILRETSEAWVDVLGEPIWLEDGSFLWLSERTGRSHLYRYGPGGDLAGPVTSGEWDVRSVYGVDSQEEWVYLASTRSSPIGLDVCRVRLDGSALQTLTRSGGTHEADFNPQHTLFIDRWSDVSTPPKLHLLDGEGRHLRTIYDKPVSALADYELPPAEFHQVTTRDGFVMEGMLIKPPDFDPSRKYPLLLHVYGGPATPRVVNKWTGTPTLWHQLLAQRGVLIWMCDNRTASGKGSRSAWPLYRRFGELELRDLEDSLDWLKKKGWVDSQRIGIWGWSFGGYLTSYALTHSDFFKLGIAGAPVTDWHLYDSIYTERYMSTPQKNPQGYESSSVLEAAGNLKGRLLLLHGSIDDNVHLQNTLKLAYELQKAGKQFDLMIYPKSRHHVSDAELIYHMRRLMTDYILDNL